MTPSVAVFRSELLPGSETFIRQQAAALERWRPVFIGALRRESWLSSPQDMVLYERPGGRRSLWDRAALWIAEHTGWSPRLARQLRRLRDQEGVRLVHAHFAKDAWLVAWAARRAGLPLVVTCHGYDVTALPAQQGLAGVWYRWRTGRVLSQAQAVIAVSQFIAGRAVALGSVEPRVMYTGVRILDRRGWEQSDDSCDVLFVGRLVPKKGAQELIRALPMVSAALGRTVRVRVVGDGPLRKAVESAARGCGAEVTFAGQVDPKTVERAMASARVLCVPSRTAEDGDCEGFGQVFMEAAAVGLPSVARRHGGVPEAVVHGHTGLLSTPGDIEALAADLVLLLTDEPLRRKLGDQARHRAQTQFDIQRRICDVEELYDQLTSDRASRYTAG